jgi:glycosyltransferase involved in cell wall biosynthesis
VEQIVKEMESIEVDYELILVANYDDAKDKTPQIAKDLAALNPRIKVVSKVKDGRMGWDMRSGMEHSKGKYIAIIDGDGQMPASDIETVYTVIKTGQYDLVKTYRAYRYDGIYRKIISSVYNLLFRILFKPAFPLNDVNSKPKILKREAYEKMNLVSSDWFTDAEIMIETINNNMKICQISTVFYKNERRRTFVGFSTIFEFINNLIYYRFFKK